VIEVDERFEVAAPPETVWQVVADPYAIVGCVPGAAIVGQNDDGTLETALGVRFGPLNIAFQANTALELDEAAMRGRLVSRGRDKQGGARFTASADFQVSATDAGSLVTARGQVEIAGRLASLIEGGANVVVKRMADDFANCLRARAEG
jgi:carbon monoxide dehydrogenase subunit G